MVNQISFGAPLYDITLLYPFLSFFLFFCQLRLPSTWIFTYYPTFIFPIIITLLNVYLLTSCTFTAEAEQ